MTINVAVPNRGVDDAVADALSANDVDVLDAQPITLGHLRQQPIDRELDALND